MPEDAAAPLIAVIEDEDHLAQGVIFNLQAEGMRTHHEADGDDALKYLLNAPVSGEGSVSAILLDCMLPGTDGFHIARALREAHRYTPILMLTARSRPEDILEGLEAGADDYLAKPFDLAILLARLKTLLRRMAWSTVSQSSTSQNEPELDPMEVYRFNGRTINFSMLELTAPARTTHLTLMEADLLRFLTDREGKIVPRKDLLEQVWRVHEDNDTRAVDNFIVRLRRYIEDDPSQPAHLLTIRGVGYRFLANPKG